MRPNIVNPIAALMLLFALLLTAGCTSDPLELPGPYDIYTQVISVANPEEPGRPIPGKIFAPSVDGGNSIAAGPFELVVFMPGFGATYSSYSPIISHLATHGAIVIGMNFITSAGFDGKHDYLARQTTYVIDYALAGESPLAGHVDATKIATAGHSLGGKISFYSAAIDPRVTVVMAMDPSNSGGPPCFIAPDFCNAYPVAPNIVTGDIGMLDHVNVASFIMRAAPDPLFNPDEQSNAKYFFYGLDGAGLHGVKAPALYFDVGNASHACWLLCLCPDIIRISKRTLVAWLKAYFHGECMEPYFTGEVIQKDIDAGYVVAVATRYCRHRP
jgi:pimeloyl-ACP methyl ester carboxylesterase